MYARVSMRDSARFCVPMTGRAGHRRAAWASGRSEGPGAGGADRADRSCAAGVRERRFAGAGARPATRRGRRSLPRNGSWRARSGTAAARRGPRARRIAAARRCVDARKTGDRGAGDRPDAARRSHRRSRTFARGAQARSENERCLCVFMRGSLASALTPRCDHAGRECSFGAFSGWATTRIAGTPWLVLSALALREMCFISFSLIKI